MVYDLLCGDSKALSPEFESFLNMTWNVTGTRVRDELEVSYSLLPLTYHWHTWPVTKLIPYLLDTCDTNATQCIYLDYVNFTFSNQDMIMNSYQTSQSAFIL